jgi:replicative DNA helicase
VPDSDPWNVDPPCFDPSLPPEPGEPDMPELVAVPDEPDEQASGEPEWPLLVGLARYADPIPIGALGPILGPLVEAATITFQVPSDLVATLAFPMITMAMQGRWTVHIKDEQTEVVALATLSILESGARKTPVQNFLADPLRKFEQQAIRGAKAQRAVTLAAHKDLENRVETLRKEIARLPEEGGAANPRAEAENRAARLRYRQAIEALDAHEVPAEPQLICDDITPEGLLLAMQDQDGGIGILSDEGGMFKDLSGRYTGTPDLEGALKGISGTPIRKNRMTYKLNIPYPRLSVCLALQPETMAGLNDKPEFRSSGLLARFLPAMPRPTTGYRMIDPPGMPVEIKQSWSRAIRGLAAHAWGMRNEARTLPPPRDDSDEDDERGRVVLTLKPGALTLFHEYEAYLEPRLRPEGDLAPIKDVGNKNPGMAVRIAAALTVLLDPEAKYIADEVMADAIRIAHGYLAHAQVALPGTGAGDPAAADPMAKIVEWLAEHGQSVVPHSVIHQHFKKRPWARTTADTEAIMSGLEARGYVRRAKQEPNAADKSKGGRKKVVWYVHPAVLADDYRPPRVWGEAPE